MNTLQCEQCGKTFSRRGTKKPRFCSIKCKAEWQRTQKPVDEAWLRQKYTAEGMSTYDIGKIVHRNPKQVYAWLVGYGIPTRPRGMNLAGADNFMAQPGARNPFEGRRHNAMTRKILSVKASVPKPYLRGAGNGMYGKRGAENANYIDGSSPERQRTYAHAEWKAVLRTIYARDSYRCVRCGATKGGPRSLHAHHIKPWAGNPDVRTDPANLVTLCVDCHHWVHSRANTEGEYIG